MSCPDTGLPPSEPSGRHFEAWPSGITTFPRRALTPACSPLDSYLRPRIRCAEGWREVPMMFLRPTQRSILVPVSRRGSRKSCRRCHCRSQRSLLLLALLRAGSTMRVAVRTARTRSVSGLLEGRAGGRVAARRNAHRDRHMDTERPLPSRNSIDSASVALVPLGLACMATLIDFASRSRSFR